ncbi:General transcription factor 3C polypeptide 5, partial [Geodia barretti]
VTHRQGSSFFSEPFYDAFEDRGVPLFLPPWAFSKFDKPSNYASRPDFQHKVTGNQVPGSSRQRRQVFAIGITFDHKGPVPSKSHPDLPEVPALHQTKLEAVKKLFEERPIWSRGWIQYRTKLPNVIVRSLLALVSYYFTNGPWKMLWVRLGYDPRSTPDSKRYQCLDYRLPREIAAVSTLEARRSKLRKGLIYAGSKKQDEFQLSGDSVQLAEAVADSNAPETEACPVFIAHQLPTQRQVYYQLCDLRDESLQTLLHANDGREDECSEANGWCEEGVYDQLRKMLGEMVRRTAERVEEERRLALETAADNTSPS